MERVTWAITGIIVLLTASLTSAVDSAADATQGLTFPKIDRRPQGVASQWAYFAHALAENLKPLPRYNSESAEPFQVDLRGRNLAGHDLSDWREDLVYADFDSRTAWPPPDKLPQGFDPSRVLDRGKNPGLGVRSLHARGVSGRGAGIAIIDQPLLLEHREYADRVRLYEEISVRPGTPSQMHGPAVASIAVGKTTGVAPEADLYYIGSWPGDWTESGFVYDFRHFAQGVRRMLEINRQLPDNRKIRVIAMQIGWNPGQAGYDDINAACAEAKAAGMLVLSSSLEETHGFRFNGMGRSPLDDPDDFSSWRPGSWWARTWPSDRLEGRLLVPMDCRATAGPNDVDDYAFYSQGGWSWCTPYLAGMYALACQVHPSTTPDEFWSLALSTGRSVEIEHRGKKTPLGPILDPVALVAALERRSQDERPGLNH